MTNNTFYYVYILESISDPTCHYTGFTNNLSQRIKEHNKGDCSHTKKYRPWRVVVAVAFTDKQRALQFEVYLKSHSGRAFAERHF